MDSNLSGRQVGLIDDGGKLGTMSSKSACDEVQQFMMMKDCTLRLTVNASVEPGGAPDKGHSRYFFEFAFVTRIHVLFMRRSRLNSIRSWAGNGRPDYIVSQPA
jgi:hypothetical protein